MAFWGAVVKATGKPAVFVPPAEGWLLHLSQAALPATVPEGKRVSLQLKGDADDQHPIVIATLTAGRLDTVALDLFLDHYAEFSLAGFQNAEVHLTGYYSPPDGVAAGPDDDDEEDEDFDGEDDEGEEEESEDGAIAAALARGGIFGRVVDDDEDGEDDEGDEDDEDEDMDDEQEPGVTRRPHVTIREITGGEDDEDEDEDEDEEEGEGEEEEEEEPPKKAAGKQQPATAAATKAGKAVANGTAPSSAGKGQQQAKQAVQQQPTAKGAAPAAAGSKRAAAEAAAQPPPKKQAGDGATPGKAAAAAGASPIDVKPGKKNIRTLPNGFSIEEVGMGPANGKLAKQGKVVKVKYVGRLKSNGKVFDGTKPNKPFAFRLGVGEVIKGWDLGVEGMREGDRRRLVIPPQLAYGSSGVRGAIPPNATLEFDVELVSVK